MALYPYSTLISTAGGNGIAITGSAGSTKDGVQLLNNGAIVNKGNGATTVTATNGNIAIGGAGGITNENTAGAITIEAKNGDINTTTAYPLTQKSNNGVTLKAKGNVGIPKILNSGTGNVVIVAGDGTAAGTGTGGQVKTLAGNTITNNGNTRIYSGNLSDTGVLSNLGIFPDLWLESDGTNAQNIQLNTTSNGTSAIAGTTAKHQVMFRESKVIDFGSSLKGATYTGTYGDSNTEVGQGEALWTSVQGALKQANLNNNLSATLSSTNTGNANVVKISASKVIDKLTTTGLQTTSYSQNGNGYLNANSSGYTYNTPTSSTYAVGFAGGEVVKAVVNKANATVTANSDTKTYNGQTQAVTGFSATGLVGGETASVLTGVTTTGGSGKNAGTYTHVASGSDSNYNLTFVDGALDISKASATVTANSDTKTYNGQTQAVTGFSATGLVGGETASVLTGVTTTGGSGKNAGTYTHVASGSDSNYNLSFVDGALTIKLPAAPSTYGTNTLSNDTVLLTPITFGFGVMGGATAAGGEVEGSCDAWLQRAGAGSISVVSLLKPSYMGLRTAKTDTMDAMAGNQATGSAPEASDNPCASAALVNRQASL